MKKKSIIYSLSMFFALSGMLISCDKNQENIPEVSIAEEDALTSLVFDDVFLEVDEAMEEMESVLYDGIKKSASEVTCKLVTIEQPNDTTFWPRTVTIDYGDECIGKNGRVRSGKIIIEVSKKPYHRDHYRIVTFDNYYVDGYKIEGEKTITNEGRNENKNIYFSVVLRNGKVTSPEGTVMTKESEKIREWVAGSDTQRYRRDDEYMVTGGASGINKDGLAFTRTIVTPLHVSMDCPWILSGTVEINAEGRETAILDFGDDTCDRYATVTVGEKTRKIKLHR